MKRSYRLRSITTNEVPPQKCLERFGNTTIRINLICIFFMTKTIVWNN